jgi:hypothetical protein
VRRWRLRLAVLGTGLALGATGAPTLAAWVDTAVNPAADVVALPDWVAPVINRVDVRKGEGGVSGYVRPGGGYRVCSNVAADTGNPPSLTQSILANVTSLAGSTVNQPLGALGGGSSPCTSPTYTNDSGALTASGSLVNGATHSVSVTARDNASNASTASASAIVDSVLPTPTSFTTANKAAPSTVNLPEAGDSLTFTFGEPIDPHAVIPGWDGQGQRTVTVTFQNQGPKDDTFTLSRADGTALPLATSVNIRENYVTATTAAFTTSTITMSGNAFTVVLGGAPTGLRQDTGTNPTAWTTHTGLYDRAGNRIAAATVTEGGTADGEF